ncbi:MAG TPA: IS110 family transposase [Gaiellaceae bacterium]|nr:IS110 family transposase [Gaiellaceae bacterium]
MIVVGVDVHKHSLTAVAVDELGRELAVTQGAVDGRVIGWGRSLEAERLWAVEDCRHVTRGFERSLLAAGERLVRVPPRLTAPQRRRGRVRGKSDAIDALAIARAALQEPRLDGPRPGEETLRELKLLVDHRDDLVDERRRAQQRLRWHLHELDPQLTVPAGALDRTVWLDRVARKLARREQTTQVRIARELVGRCRLLTRSIVALDRELETRSHELAPRLLELPGCGPLSAAKLLCEIGPIERFTSDAQLARHAGVAPLDASSGKHQRHRLDRGGNRQLNCALHRIAVTQGRWHPPARAYLERKQSEGKTRREALRCLKRQLARVVFNTLKTSPALT